MREGYTSWESANLRFLCRKSSGSFTIDFEVQEGEQERARALYEHLIEMISHFKVWISYALFEAEAIRVGREEGGRRRRDNLEEGGR
jgi:hypothetical protein